MHDGNTKQTFNFYRIEANGKLAHMGSATLLITFDPDGIMTFAYNGRTIGWVNEIKYPEHDQKRYRAVAVNGHSGHFWSIDTAREFLFTEAF